jgi:hypothetical protein
MKILNLISKNFLSFVSSQFFEKNPRINFNLYLIPLILIGYSTMGQDCNHLPTTFDRVFNNGMVVTTAASFANINIHISGTVSFNADISFVGCNVFMDPGATLNINNSHFIATSSSTQKTFIFGCTTMWNAVNINAGGSIEISNTEISDGNHGIAFHQGYNPALSGIWNCNFKANNTAITASNITTGFTLYRFSGNYFGGNISTASSAHPIAPYTTNVTPINAILLTNVTSGSIGTVGTINQCDNMSSCISMNNSSIILFNFYLYGGDNHAKNRDNINPHVTCGIYANNSSITVQDLNLTNTGNFRFEYLDEGIKSIRTAALTVQNARFVQQDIYDINVDNSTSNAYNVVIKNNTFILGSPSKGSVLINRAAFQGAGPFLPIVPIVHTDISNNFFHLDNTTPWTHTLTSPITFLEVTNQAGAWDIAKISNNSITCVYGNGPTNLAYAINGIRMTGTPNVFGYHVFGNNIDFTNPTQGPANTPLDINNKHLSTGFGIHSNNLSTGFHLIGPNNNISSVLFAPQTGGNIQDAATLGSWLRCGIHLDVSPDVFVCSNIVNNVTNNYHFNTHCENIDFASNSIGNGYKGLAIDTRDISNGLDYRNNRWLPDANFTYFIDSGVNTQFTSGNNTKIWLVDNTVAGNALGYVPPNPVSPSNWLIGGVPPNTPPQTGCDFAALYFQQFGNFKGTPVSELVANYLNGDYGSTNSTEVWDTERWLIGQMYLNPPSFSGNTVAQQFYDSKISTVQGLLAQGEMMLSNANSEPTNSNFIEQWKQNHQVRMDTIRILENMIASANPSLNSTLQLAKSYVLSEESTMFSSVLSSCDAIKSQQLSNLSAVKSFINNIQTTNLLESNYKTLLFLMIKNAANDTLTNLDSIALRSIAYSCSTTGGVAVNTARSMLPRPESFNFYPDLDDPYCVSSRDDRNQLKLDEISILPNPANSSLRISFPNLFTRSLEIFNITGNLVWSNDVNEFKDITILTNNFPDGVYIVKAAQNGRLIANKKIIVAH